jgi:hypothetical protein
LAASTSREVQLSFLALQPEFDWMQPLVMEANGAEVLRADSSLSWVKTPDQPDHEASSTSHGVGNQEAEQTPVCHDVTTLSR